MAKAHLISKKTRRSIEAIIDEYGIDREDAAIAGLLDRRIRGYLHAKAGNARLAWPKNRYVSGKELHYVCDVASGRDLDLQNKWKKPYKIGARFQQDNNENVYRLEEVGTEIRFRMRGQLEIISGHSCEDIIFQKGYKGLPTTCYHICAVRYFLPEALTEEAFQDRLELRFVDPHRIEIDEGLCDLYREIYQHKLKAWQRLNILYAYQTGKLRMWRSGQEFLSSVKPFLKNKRVAWAEILF